MRTSHGKPGVFVGAAMLNSDRAFFTPKEIADLLRVDHHKILRLIHNGELKAVDVSLTRSKRARWRIAREELEKLLKRRSSKSPPKRLPRRRKREDDDTIRFIWN